MGENVSGTEDTGQLLTQAYYRAQTKADSVSHSSGMGSSSEKYPLERILKHPKSKEVKNKKKKKKSVKNSDASLCY